jgi:hypothetical protein
VKIFPIFLIEIYKLLPQNESIFEMKTYFQSSKFDIDFFHSDETVRVKRTCSACHFLVLGNIKQNK